jgi:hypothetical protein
MGRSEIGFVFVVAKNINGDPGMGGSLSIQTFFPNQYGEEKEEVLRQVCWLFRNIGGYGDR